MPPSVKILKSDISDWFIADLNLAISNLALPALTCVEKLGRIPYVCEHDSSSTISKFRLGVAELGNREPRLGHQRERFCPLCSTNQPNSEFHLVCVCQAVSAKRSEIGLTSFINQCLYHGSSLKDAFCYFINGLDCYGKPVARADVLNRGVAF